MSRGLKNCNPGNIRRSATTYKGEITSTDPAFKAFESMPWGYRAMFVLLHTYQVRYACRTIRQMILRYAPPVENNTEAYIRAVSASASVGDAVNITATNRDIMIPVVAAMSRVENGVAANMADVTAGWELFIKHKP